MYRRLNRVVYQLNDFGTQQYDSSIILFFSVGPLKPGSRGDGHYETVCLFAADDGSAHTVLERNHPLLNSLRAWAIQHSDDCTLEHERIKHFCHPAISVRSGEQFVGPPASSPDCGVAFAGVGGRTTDVGARPRRSRTIPARFRDQQSGGRGGNGSCAFPPSLRLSLPASATAARLDCVNSCSIIIALPRWIAVAVRHRVSCYLLAASHPHRVLPFLRDRMDELECILRHTTTARRQTVTARLRSWQRCWRINSSSSAVSSPPPTSGGMLCKMPLGGCRRR